MSDEMKDTFSNLSDALDADFEGIDEQLEVIESTKLEIVQRVESDVDVTLEDKSYMQDTLKLMIESGKNVLQIIEKDIKIGSPSRQAEVFFNGMAKVSDTVKSLMELNKSVEELKIKDKKSTNSGTKNLTVNQIFTSKDLLQMMKKAEEESSIKEIKAEFRIEDDSL